MQEVHISKAVKMIDSPGIIATPSNPPVSMVLRSLKVEEKEESPVEAVRILLNQCNQQQVRPHYFLIYFLSSRKTVPLKWNPAVFTPESGVQTLTFS